MRPRVPVGGLFFVLALAFFAHLGAPVLAEDAPTWQGAQKLAREGDLPRAILAARTLLVAEPTHAAAARLLQDLLVETGTTDKPAFEQAAPEVRRGIKARKLSDPKRTVAEFTNVLKSESASALFRIDLARALRAWDRPAQAESEIQRFLKTHPADPEGLTELGHVLAMRGKEKDARAAFERALAPDPGLAAPAVALARLHAAEERPADARAVLAKALRAYPANPALVRGLAEDQVRAGELDLALGTLDRLLTLPTEKSKVHARMAEVHRLRGNLADAERCAQAALAVNPQSAQALRVIGFVKQKKDDMEGALATYERAAEFAPLWAPIRSDIGFVQMQLGKTLLAERSLRKALELDKNLIEARRSLGITMFMRGKPKLAKKELDIVLKADDDDVRANRYMGYLLLDEGKAKAALKHFGKVAELAPKDSASVRMMGNCHMQMGRIEQAIEAYQEAIGRDPKDGFPYFDMGKALEKQERWQDSAASYRKAIELDAKLAHPHLYLAELLDEVLDEPEEALQHYKRYLELDGHGEGGWIKLRIGQLERELEEKEKGKK